jgi:hypothetical protein
MDAGLPPPPPRPDTAEPARPPTPVRDRTPLVVVAVALLLLGGVVAGLVVAVGGENEPRAGRPGEVVDGSGTVYRLEVHDESEAPETAETATLDLTATLTLMGESAADVRVADLDARYNGVPIPVGLARTQTLHLSERNVPDTVVLVATDATGSFNYFLDMLFPVVPSGPLSNGDTWPVSFEARLPAATGSATYEGTGTVLGRDQRDGTDATKVRNELTFEYDFTWDAAEASEMSGLGSAPSGTVEVTGSGSMTLTGWIDRGTDAVVLSEVEGTYDASFTYADFAIDEIPDATYTSSGAFNTTLERQAEG